MPTGSKPPYLAPGSQPHPPWHQPSLVLLPQASRGPYPNLPAVAAPHCFPVPAHPLSPDHRPAWRPFTPATYPGRTAVFLPSGRCWGLPGLLVPRRRRLPGYLEPQQHCWSVTAPKAASSPSSALHPPKGTGLHPHYARPRALPHLTDISLFSLNPKSKATVPMGREGWGALWFCSQGPCKDSQCSPS